MGWVYSKFLKWSLMYAGPYVVFPMILIGLVMYSSIQCACWSKSFGTTFRSSPRQVQTDPSGWVQYFRVQQLYCLVVEGTLIKVHTKPLLRLDLSVCSIVSGQESRPPLAARSGATNARMERERESIRAQ